MSPEREREIEERLSKQGPMYFSDIAELLAEVRELREDLRRTEEDVDLAKDIARDALLKVFKECDIANANKIAEDAITKMGWWQYQM